jgi:hypothetical protein
VLAHTRRFAPALSLATLKLRSYCFNYSARKLAAHIHCVHICSLSYSLRSYLRYVTPLVALAAHTRAVLSLIARLLFALLTNILLSCRCAHSVILLSMVVLRTPY